MGKLKFYHFSSGATLIYRKRKSNNATALIAGFNCGYIDAPKNFNGLPHLLEHMLFKGTKKRTSKQIEEDKVNITRLNASTSEKSLCVNFYESNRKIKESFEFASDVLLNSNFEDKNIKNEVKVVLEEKNRDIYKSLNNIYYQTNIALRSKFPSNEMIFGTENSLNKVNSKVMNNFVNDYFTEKNFLCSIVSNSSFKKIKKLVKEYFLDKIKNKNNGIQVKPYNILEIDKPEKIAICKNENNTYKFSIAISFESENDYKYDYNLDFITSYIQTNSNLLYCKARNQGLVYNLEADIIYNRKPAKTKAIVFTYETSKIENIDKLIELTSETIQELKTNGIKQNEIDKIYENYLLNDDKKSPSDYRSSCSRAFYNYLVEQEESAPKSKKYINKQKRKVNEESIKKNIDLLFNENNKVIITIIGNIEKNQLKTIKYYKNLLLKKG